MLNVRSVEKFVRQRFPGDDVRLQYFEVRGWNAQQRNDHTKQSTPGCSCPGLCIALFRTLISSLAPPFFVPQPFVATSHHKDLSLSRTLFCTPAMRTCSCTPLCAGRPLPRPAAHHGQRQHPGHGARLGHRAVALPAPQGGGHPHLARRGEHRLAAARVGGGICEQAGRRWRRAGVFCVCPAVDRARCVQTGRLVASLPLARHPRMPAHACLPTCACRCATGASRGSALCH